MPGGMLGSVTAVTSALAVALTATGGAAPRLTNGVEARLFKDWSGRNPSTLSSGTPVATLHCQWLCRQDVKPGSVQEERQRSLTHCAQRDAHTADLPRAMHEARPHSHTSVGEQIEQRLLSIALALEVARQEELCTHVWASAEAR